MEKVAQSQPVSRQPYPSDLTDIQWDLLQPMLVLPEGGRPRETDLREVINGILYYLRTGCGWRMLPHEFPPEGTVRRYFHYFKRTNQWEKINDELRREVRVQEGRDEEPSLVIIDSQSAKGTSTSSESGYDAGKKINGIKRHIMVDVLGILICVVVHMANIQERAGAKLLLAKAQGKGLTRLIKVLADDGYNGQPMVDYVRETHGWESESVKRPKPHEFQVAPNVGWWNVPSVTWAIFVP